MATTSRQLSLFQCRFSGILLGSASLIVLPALTVGCGSSSSAPNLPPEPAVLSGKVFGGQQPINGASINLYQVGTAGPGVGAASLLQAAVTSYPDGGFTVSNDYTCPSSTTQVYIVARGGNPGLSTNTDNQASVLIAALGDCGNLSASPFIQIDEVTTAAAAWSLAQFLSPGAVVGSTSSNANGLRNAFLVANSLVDTSTGLPGGPSLPPGAALEPAKLYTLANALAGCVNSDGGSNCDPLFQAAEVNGSRPTNTLDAALNIVRQPAHNIAAVFNAAPVTGPFLPQLSQVPNDWSMSLTFSGGGLNGPTSLAIDSTGSVWAANYLAGTASKFSSTGEPAAAQGFSDPSLHESLGITIDPHDNVWITNQETTNGANGGLGSITKLNSSGQTVSGAGFSAGGIYFPYAAASDANGDIWVADYARSGLSLLAQDGSSLLGPSGLAPTEMTFPVAVAVDSSNNGWFGSQGGPVRVTAAGVVTAFSCGCTPSALSLDPSGNIWVADYFQSSLYEIGADGTILQQLAAVNALGSPQSLAVDGAGNVWLANAHGQTISGFTKATGGAISMAISPPTGFGPDSPLISPYGIAVDASGNLWTSDFTGNTLREFVGLAAPVRTPSVGPPTLP